MTVDPDSFSRTAKILADSNDVSSFEEAEKKLETFVLQVHSGTGISGNPSRQAALLSVVNTASRAFKGGVRVQLLDDAVLQVGWHRGALLGDTLQRYGAILVHNLTGDHPTICIGEPGTNVSGRPILRATFDGWTAGVVEGTESPLAERSSFVPAGVAAAGIAVGEAFEFCRRNIRAGRRNQGVSLWRPEAKWLNSEACGPLNVAFVPSSWWLVGLGHLGQGYLWNIGMFPYPKPGDVHVMLQDDDLIIEANESTGLLLEPGRVGQRKAREVAEVLRKRGFTTSITERRLYPGQGPTGHEPRLALFGVDNPETRSTLSEMGFEFVVDAGLGSGPVHYLDIQIHTFPCGRDSRVVEAWRQTRSLDKSLLELPAYRRATDETGDECGTIEIAGRSVAAAFVGATAGALVIAEATRALAGQHRYGVMDLSLRDLAGTQAVEAADVPAIANTGFARLV